MTVKKNYNRKETRQAWLLENKQKLLENHRKRNKRSPRYAFSSSLAMARKRAEVTIDQNYLMKLYDDQEGLCALSGIRMTWATGKTAPTSISMDRIDPLKGYVEGNVRLICMAVNAFRGTMNDDELLKFAKSLVNHMTSAKIVAQKIEEFV